MINKLINTYKTVGKSVTRLRREAPLLYSALKTGMAAFGAVMLPVLAGFMTDLYLWVDNGEGFPVTDSLLRALVAGAIGFIAAVINFGWNIRSKAMPPTYPEGNQNGNND